MQQLSHSDRKHKTASIFSFAYLFFGRKAYGTRLVWYILGKAGWGSVSCYAEICHNKIGRGSHSYPIGVFNPLRCLMCIVTIEYRFNEALKLFEHMFPTCVPHINFNFQHHIVPTYEQVTTTKPRTLRRGIYYPMRKKTLGIDSVIFDMYK